MFQLHHIPQRAKGRGNLIRLIIFQPNLIGNKIHHEILIGFVYVYCKQRRINNGMHCVTRWTQ